MEAADSTVRAAGTLEVAIECEVRDHRLFMSNTADARPREGKELISLAQQLARDAERHALLSASLASQADRLMGAGLRLLDRRALDAADPRGKQ